MQYKTLFLLSVSLVGSFLLSSCTRSLSHMDSTGKTNAPVFPALSSAVRGEGSFPDVSHLETIRAGMTKQQVYDLIGTPHFHEGMFAVREWDYIFHFATGKNQALTCQYKVIFDSQLRVGSTYYKPANCLQQIHPAEPTPVMTKSLNADVLFGFDSAVLSLQGRQAVRALAQEIATRDKAHPVGKIVVTGYTDPVGSENHNDLLSQRRAEAVRAVLVDAGFSAGLISAGGRGERDLVVVCPLGHTPSIIACNSDNRRVTVDIF